MADDIAGCPVRQFLHTSFAGKQRVILNVFKLVNVFQSKSIAIYKRSTNCGHVISRPGCFHPPEFLFEKMVQAIASEIVAKQIITSVYSRVFKREFLFNLLIDYLLIRLYIQLILFHFFRAPPCGSFIVRANILYHRRSFIYRSFRT